MLPERASNMSMLPPRKRRGPIWPPECPHTPLMPLPSFLQSVARARRHRFHRSSSQFWGDKHAASTSLQFGTRRSSEASDPHRKSDVSARFTFQSVLLDSVLLEAGVNLLSFGYFKLLLI